MFKQALIYQLSKLSGRLPLDLTVLHSDGGQQRIGRGGTEITLTIKHPSCYRRLVWDPVVGFGELYAEGALEAASRTSPDPLFELLRAFFALNFSKTLPNWAKTLVQLLRSDPRANDLRRSTKNVEVHYDANDKIVREITGRTLTYSCAFFADPRLDLDRAQDAKIAYLLHKARLTKGQRLLDIGCGYGELVRQAAKYFGARDALGITLSREQFKTGDELVNAQGLSQRCRLKLIDWRDVNESFDRIVSVGMYEHVGRQHWAEFFRKIGDLLADDGVFVLHTICTLSPMPMNRFITKYIFPGSRLPTIAEVVKAAESTGLILRDFENLREHYAETVRHWLNALRAKRDRLTRAVGEKRFRLFEVYLAGGRASFMTPGGMQLGQFVFTKDKTDWPQNRAFMLDWLKTPNQRA